MPRRDRWWWPVPIALALVAMLPTLPGQLVWDDEYWLRQIGFFTSLGTVLLPPPGIPDWPYGYYRPMVTLSNLLDHRLFGIASPGGRHLASILYHAISTGMVWLLVRRLLAGSPGAPAAALIGAAVFAVHPIHTESVCWIGARVDVLATMFLAPAILLALSWRDSRSTAALLLGPALFLAALGSKEVAIAGVVLVPLAVWLAPVTAGGVRAGRAGTWIPLALLYSGACAIYLVYRAAATIGVPTQLDWPFLWNLPRALAWYLMKLVYPWPQSNYITWEMLPGRVPALVTVLLALAVLAWSALRWKRKRDHGTLVFGLLWIGATLAPSLYVAVTTTAATPVAERYLYLPSVGLSIVLAAVAGEFATSRWARSTLMASAALVVIYLAGSIVRSSDWGSNLRLWTSTTRQASTQGLPWVELAKAHYAAGNVDDAQLAYEQSRELENVPYTRAVAEYNLGIIYLKKGQLEQAERAFVASRLAQPDYPLAYYGLGLVYARRGSGTGPASRQIDLLAQAQLHFREAIRLDPSFGEARLEIVRVLLRQGDVLAGAGRPTDAATSYRAGASQLEAMIQVLPALATQAGIPELRAELRRKAAAGLNPAPP